jgi:uncharacterized protein YbcV (DUF1398 family)
MFTISQIKEAHAKVKSGADFPRYVQDLIKLGIVNYSTYVHDGHTEYKGDGNYSVQSDASPSVMDVTAKSDAQKFTEHLKIHQQGQTDYATFRKDSADTGVEKWTVDMKAMTCTYYDQEGNKMLVERIPEP